MLMLGFVVVWSWNVLLLDVANDFFVLVLGGIVIDDLDDVEMLAAFSSIPLFPMFDFLFFNSY